MAAIFVASRGLVRRKTASPSSFIRSCLTARYSTGSAFIAEDYTHVLGKDFPRDDMTNVVPKVLDMVNRKLHQVNGHPLNLIKRRIHQYFDETFHKSSPSKTPLFTCLDDIYPVVTTEQNFDELLLPKDHVARSKLDNYYVNSTHLLRAHTSAHQAQNIRSGLDAFLLSGDVYRRDTVDCTHFPCFHQMEGVRLFSAGELFSKEITPPSLFADHAEEPPDHQAVHCAAAAKLVEEDLKRTLEGLVRHLFGSDTKMEWATDYFPFTHPSWELNVFFQGKWLEVLGCGVMRQAILNNAGASDKIGWAFGVGLERLAMILYDIPDIRMFWSKDTRFLDQFKPAIKNLQAPVKFQRYLTHAILTRDISFWTLHGKDFSGENDIMEIAREEAGDAIEAIELVDYFENPKAKPGDLKFSSYCYRLSYRSPDREVSQDEINDIQFRVREKVADRLNVTLR